MNILSLSPQYTSRLAKKIGSLLQEGDVLALVGEIGAGKTHFVKALALGLGVKPADNVSSPSFVIIREYTGKKLPLYHFDLYRLRSHEEMFQLGYEEYFYGKGVTVVEWADKEEELLPDKYLRIEFIVTGEKERVIKLKSFGNRYKKIIKEL